MNAPTSHYTGHASIDHVCGTSLFLDSYPPRQDEVHVGVVFSPFSTGKIKQIDFSEVKKMPGFVACFTAEDFPHNLWGPIMQDTPFLAQRHVNYAGEPIALLAFDNKNALRAAKTKIGISIEADANQKQILTIDDAMNERAFFDEQLKIECGDVAAGFASAAHILESDLRINGQEHFYFETQAALAIPEEADCLRIISSTQHPSEVQHVCAHALGLAYHQLSCEVLRMGGAFGGKESQASHIAALAALVAYKTGRPARLILEREEDMEITGKRHGYLCKYKVGFDSNGKITALAADLFSDGGYYLDLSPAILQRSLLHIDNCYYLPNVQVKGSICRTNTAPNTAFRGFGGPQGMAVIESIMEEVSMVLKKDAYEVRNANLYGNAPATLTTPYGQTVDNNMIPELFSQLQKSSDYFARRQSIVAFNQQNKFLVRGLAVCGSKFGISFTTRFLNQGNALVNIHRDGTIQVSTGATEMGQGVNEKIAKVVALSFGVPFKNIRVMPTSTTTNANTSATAASSGSDINGSAALAACDKIKQRLANIAVQAFKQSAPASSELEVIAGLDTSSIVFSNNSACDRNSNKSLPLRDLINLCYLNRISLSDYAHYKYPGIGFDKATGKGKPFLYFTQGAAVSEVSVDRFSGEVKVLRTDILMDLGRPLDQLIDYGQVSGAFIQGMGWVTSEEIYRENGKLIARSPTTYKIPNINDTPRVFNIEFIENLGNSINLKGSKAVGEPPFPLALSVWCAVKNALSTLHPNKIPHLKLPATNEAIIMVDSRDLPS